MPDVSSFIVVGVYGYVKPLLVQLQLFSEKAPGISNRFLLEIVPEGEIAEHFKKSMVPGRSADIFQVIMLAACAHTLLRTDGPEIVTFLHAEETVLELVHPGISEQQSRIVMGNKS